MGDVLFENRSRSHREYCLAPIAHKGGTHLELHACPTEDNSDTLKMDILPYCKCDCEKRCQTDENIQIK